MDPVFEAFTQELEKRAVSAASTLKLLQGRAAQGARIAPGLMAKAEQAAASGMTRTAPTMRRMALDAGDAARLQQRTQAMGAVKAPLQSRIQAADAMGAKAFDQAKPLRLHDAFGNTHGYSQAHIDTIAGSASRVADPKGLIAAKPAGTGPTGTVASSGASQATVVGKKRPGLAPVRQDTVTSATQIAPTVVQPMTGITRAA